MFHKLRRDLLNSGLKLRKGEMLLVGDKDLKKVLGIIFLNTKTDRIEIYIIGLDKAFATTTNNVLNAISIVEHADFCVFSIGGNK